MITDLSKSNALAVRNTPELAIRDLSEEYSSKAYGVDSERSIDQELRHGTMIDVTVKRLIEMSQNIGSHQIEPDYFEVFTWLEQNMPLVQMVVMSTIDHIMGSGSDVEMEVEITDDFGHRQASIEDEVLDWLQEIDALTKFYQMFHDTLVYGNSFSLPHTDESDELLNYFFLNPMHVRDIAVRFDGDVQYTVVSQILKDFTNQEITTREDTYINQLMGEWQISHYQLYPQTVSRWGRSLLRSSVQLLMVLYKAYGDIGTIWKRYGSPLTIIQVAGSLGKPVTEEVMQQVGDNWRKVIPRTAWVVPKGVYDFDVKPSLTSSVNAAILNPIEAAIIGGFNYPRGLLLEVSNRSVLDDQLEAWYKKMRSIVYLTMNEFHRTILRKKLHDMGLTKEFRGRVRFPRVADSTKALVEKALAGQHISFSGQWTPDEVRERLWGMGKIPGGDRLRTQAPPALDSNGVPINIGGIGQHDLAEPDTAVEKFSPEAANIIDSFEKELSRWFSQMYSSMLSQVRELVTEAGQNPRDLDDYEISQTIERLYDTSGLGIDDETLRQVIDKWVRHSFSAGGSNSLRQMNRSEAFTYSSAEVERWFDQFPGILANQVKDDILNKVKREIAESIISGIHPNQIVRRVGTIMNQTPSYAKQISRTYAIKAYARGSLNGYEQAGIERVKFKATLGSEKTEQECLKLHNQIFSVQRADSIIPVHPNCRCTWVPIVE